MHATAARAPAPSSAAGPAAGLLQRRCACGGTPGPSGECDACRRRRLARMQRKARVGAPDDAWEREADRVADRVAGAGVRALAPVRATPAAPLLRRRGEGEGPDAAPPVVDEVLASPGRPLEPATRAAMEARFGHDFGRVRVHTDARAARSARAVDARAYTVGSSIVFGERQYAPGTDGGRWLLAHELTHVLQQGAAGGDGPAAAPSAAPRPVAVSADTAGGAVLRRVCGEAAIGHPTGCTVPPNYGFYVGSNPYRFDRACDDFAAGEEGRMRADVAALPPTATLQIHGFASIDGPAGFNHDLACARALAARASLTGAGGGVSPARILAVFNHGPTPGPAADRRSVTIVSTTPTQPEPEPEPVPRCGPDATDWFVNQVNTAMTDPSVLSVRSFMSAADRLARTHGTTAAQVAEGGAAAAVLAQETKLSVVGPAPPPRNATINAQLRAGIVSGAAAAGALTPSSIFDPKAADAAAIMLLLGSGAMIWKGLVDHAARYDFKAHTDSMRHPHTANCPQAGCPPGEVGIVTLCPGTNPQNCYESDLPGNLFYALIGRHAGFSELTLQLGSQMAELTDTTPRPARPVVTWDSPEDTAAIALGFSLPLPLTRTAFCSALSPARARLAHRVGCDDCLDPTPSRIR